MEKLLLIFCMILSVGCTTEEPTGFTEIGGDTSPPISGIQETPVLVVPGLFGSMSTELLGNKQKYVDAMERILRFVEKSYPGTLCGTEIPAQWTPDPLRCTYDAVIAALGEAGHTVRAFPYDWRKAPDNIIPALDAQVQSLAAQSDSGTIAVVAHSYGGIVLRACMQAGLCAQVAQAVFVGTPHRGAVEAYYLNGGEATGESRGEIALKEGLLSVMKWSQVGADVDALFDGDIGTGPDLFDYQYVQEHIPAVGKLTPTFGYIRKWHTLSKMDEPVAYNNLCRRNVWLENLNANIESLFAQNVRVLNITGTGSETPEEILVRDLGLIPCAARTRWPNGDPGSLLLANAPQRVWKVDGDGVVTVASARFPAQLASVTEWLAPAGVSHRALIMDERVIKAVVDYLAPPSEGDF